MRFYLIVFLFVGVSILFGLATTERAIEDVLHNGYSTTAQIVSAAQTSRRFPIIFDGWRPRWVDQNLSVELKWIGKDGVERSRRGVPASDALAARLDGNAGSRLASVSARVIDDGDWLPVIEEDAPDRLRHIRGFAEFMRPVVILLALALAAELAWSRFFAGPARQTHPEAKRRPFPFVPAMLAVFSLGVGAMMAIGSWTDRRDVEEMAALGETAVAKITRAHAEVTREGDPPSYLVDLAWRDSRGTERIFGPTHISTDFWRRITANGVLTTDRAEIRYLARDPASRPIILADAAERELQDRIGMGAGVGFFVFGLIMAAFAAYRMRSA
ncbi:hypothetical protein [Methylosinus sporium]|uniref:hypothetical protein n=1 Tax=Methylosinus sporium TaxID=428 RepID=UPI003839FE47